MCLKRCADPATAIRPRTHRQSNALSLSTARLDSMSHANNAEGQGPAPLPAPLDTSLSSTETAGDHHAIDVTAKLDVFVGDKPSLTPSAIELGPTLMDLTLHGRVEGTSSWGTGVGHLITALIGAGVLSLPNSFAALGWGLAPLLLALFGAATVWSTCYLSRVCETPTGKRYYTYKSAVRGIMGSYHPNLLAVILYINMVLAAIGYTLAGMTSIKFISKTACSYTSDDISSCPMTSNRDAILLFSGLQLIINMLPNLESIWWVSAVGAAMSYLYSALAVILSCKQLASDGPASDTTAWGTEASSTFKRAIGMFGALGNLAFAWSAGLMLPSIQATLKEPPKAVVGMRKVIGVSYSSTAAFYFAISCLGYAALGSEVPGDVLTGFSVSREVELVANIAVLLHMVAAVQVYIHPVFEGIEEALVEYVPCLVVDVPFPQMLAVRFVYRCLCTVLVTGVGYGLPHFSLISGLNGAVTFWPLQIGYPFAMYLKTYPPTKRVRYLMHATSAFFVCACILATIGCLYALATMPSE